MTHQLTACGNSLLCARSMDILMFGVPVIEVIIFKPIQNRDRHIYISARVKSVMFTGIISR